MTKCILCGREITGHGHNPEPLADFDEGRCCDECNSKRVIPARILKIKEVVGKMNKEEKVRSLMDFFGISQAEAEAQLEDMGEISYGERETKPRGAK